MSKKPMQSMQLWTLVKEEVPLFQEEIPFHKNTADKYFKILRLKQKRIERFIYNGDQTVGISKFIIYFLDGDGLAAYNKVVEKFPSIERFKNKFRDFAYLLQGHIKKNNSNGFLKYIE